MLIDYAKQTLSAVFVLCFCFAIKHILNILDVCQKNYRFEKHICQ